MFVSVGKDGRNPISPVCLLYTRKRSVVDLTHLMFKLKYSEITMSILRLLMNKPTWEGLDLSTEDKMDKMDSIDYL